MKTHFKKSIVLLLVILGFLPLSCCDILRVLPTDALTQVNQAIETLDNNSSQWQQVLTGLQSTIDEAFKQDVTTILDRAVSSTAEQVNCLTDIRIQQIRNALLALRAKITNEAPPIIEPIICLVTPTSIQMSLLSSPTSPRKFDISGYDMDKGNIRVRIEHQNGSSTTLPRNVFSLQTHYHATVDFSNVILTTTMVKFIVSSGETRLSEVGIIQKQCETKPGIEDPQTIELNSFEIPRGHRGDKDFGFFDAIVNVDVVLHISRDRNQVLGDFDVSVSESNDGDTRGIESRRNVVLFTNADRAYEIIEIINPRTYRHRNFTNSSEDPQTQQVGGGLINSITYHVKRFGTNDLDNSEVDFNLSSINVVLRERSGCVN